MITLQIQRPWHICTPQVFRYLPTEFVDCFFTDGTIRLSSFAQFAQHVDEQRLDSQEGETTFVHRHFSHGGQTLTAKAFHGRNAYVLCATMLHSDALMSDFGCDSYMRVNDPTQFGTAVALHVPAFMGGAEGPCLYQEHKIIERDLGYLDVAQFGDPESNASDRMALAQYLNDQMGHYPHFLKHKTYSHQVEYRWLWFTSSPVADYLDLRVPEAIAACSRPSEITQ